MNNDYTDQVLSVFKKATDAIEQEYVTGAFSFAAQTNRKFLSDIDALEIKIQSLYNDNADIEVITNVIRQWYLKIKKAIILFKNYKEVCNEI